MFDALFFVSFGGPEKHEDVMPFLENVLRGKPVPKERMLEVAQHYYDMGGKSPINDQNLAMIEKLKTAFAKHNIDLPIYFGNRNWKPYIADALDQMKSDGIQHALAYFTSAYSSYSGCRQYRENIIRAQEQIGQGAPQVSKLRMFFNHPLFIEAVTENMKKALHGLSDASWDNTHVLYTAHSIPLSMSENCDYVKQLTEACRLTDEALNIRHSDLVYQSRSGPPQVPWLAPDVCDAIEALDNQDIHNVLVMPIGFVSDHMEVMYDLDIEAKEAAQKSELGFARAQAAGHHEVYPELIVDLVKERMGKTQDKKALGDLGPWHDVCPPDCCTYTPRRPKMG